MKRKLTGPDGGVAATVSRAGRIVVAVVLFGGLAFSVALWKTLDDWENQSLRTELHARAGARARLLDASVRQSMDVLYGISSLIAARSIEPSPRTTANSAEASKSPEATTSPGSARSSVSTGAGVPLINRREFRAFVAQALSRQPELQAIGWTPRVPRDQRAAFEGLARAEGLHDFEFRQVDAAGHPVRVPERDEYFPIYFLEPQADNALALGFELDSDPIRTAALHNAAETGQPTATAPMQLVQKPQQGLGFVVYLPVYATDTAPAAAGRVAANQANGPALKRNLIGFASAVFRIHHLVAPAERGLTEDGLLLSIVDQSAGGERIHGGDDDAPGARLAGVAPVSLAGRHWSLSLRPTPAFVARHRHRESLVVLGSGIVISVLLSFYITGGLRRRAVIERRVHERTRQLQTAEAKARSIFEHAVEGMFQTTVDGRYLSANPALAALYGYESSAALTAELADVGDQLYVDPSRRREFVRCVQRDGVVMDFESQVRQRDGRIIWICENARVVRDTSGSVLYFEGSVVDITDRKHAEQVLRSDREALETRVMQRTAQLDRAVAALQGEVAERARAQSSAAAASQAKSLFLANISHEIRTPMNAILGYAQLLGGDANLTAGQREAMGTILSSGRHLLDLIDDVLDLSKIEAGRSEVNASAFALHDAVREVTSLFAGRCAEKGLRLKLEAADGAWPACVWGDSRKLRQVLINLLGNAVKFTDVGGITVRVERRSDVRYRFEVADTGIGIRPEAMSSIFEPFQQAPSGARRGGTGLGLSIARGQIEAMGGKLGVVSSPGAGACFDFELDLPATSVENALPQRLSRVLSPQRPVRAMVVDDVPESRRVVAELLRRIGCDVVEASGAAEAVAVAESHGPELAMLDIMMPEVNGLKLADLLVARLGPGLKLLAMSASATPDQRRRCDEAGFAAFIAKPVELDRLAVVVSRLVGVPLESKPAPAPLQSNASPAADLLPALRRRILHAARRCSVTDLKQCLAEAESDGPPSAVVLLRRGLRSYDMDHIVQSLGGDSVDPEDR